MLEIIPVKFGEKCNNLVYYDIISDGNLARTMLLMFTCRETLWLEELYIDEEFRNCGIGTNVVKWLVEFSRKFGIKSLKLFVAFQNEDAQKLYRRLGFEYLPHISQYCYLMEFKPNQ